MAERTLLAPGVIAQIDLPAPPIARPPQVRTAATVHAATAAFRRRDVLAAALAVAGSGVPAPARAAGGLAAAHLRVARATDDLVPLLEFYRDGLGFEVVYEFRDHAGFDGVMLALPGAAYHLEFTRTDAHRAGRAPGPENLLVFFLPDDDAYRAALARLEAGGHRAIAAFNPYWDQHGRTFEDPDGYRVVLQNSSWPPTISVATDGSMPSRSVDAH